MENVFKVISDWKDDLIRCPSQCYKNIEYKGRHFVIYLRWRWSDPWQCKLVECPPNLEFDMHTQFEWTVLSVKHFTHDELELLKVNAEKLVNKWLLKNENKRPKLR